MEEFLWLEEFAGLKETHVLRLDCFYNNHCLHSVLGHRSLHEYERLQRAVKVGKAA